MMRLIARTGKRNGLCILTALVLGAGLFCAAGAMAASDLAKASGSTIAGITFDDPPLNLPPQRNFQMAMLTASSELGRSCGKMEAYGWRMGANEQERVNQIFNSTVDRMRGQGFVVESKAPTSVSRDVTLFTADRADKHLVFLWSAGEIGLVMVVCETSAPLAPTGYASSTLAAAPPLGTFPETGQALRSKTEPVLLTRTGKPSAHAFSPLGSWVGTYTCSQGTTGGTLTVKSLRGDQFEGTFRFYPTTKNPYVPAGHYAVFGEYDSESQRILVNPGKWLERPKDYFSTIMIGSFDPAAKTFSGYFQGINGCTSFEARYGGSAGKEGVKAKPAKKKAVKAKTAKPKPKKAKAAQPAKAKDEAKPAEAAKETPSARESGASFETPGIKVEEKTGETTAPSAAATPAATPSSTPSPEKASPEPSPTAPVASETTPAKP